MGLHIKRKPGQGFRIRLGLEEIWIYLSPRQPSGSAASFVIIASEKVDIMREEMLTFKGPLFNAETYNSIK